MKIKKIIISTTVSLLVIVCIAAIFGLWYIRDMFRHDFKAMEVPVTVTVTESSRVTDGMQNTNSQWRGEKRDGIYNETGLLKEWPADGPELLWYVEGLGDGYTSPAIANGKIYITGLDGNNLVLFVFDLDGKFLNRKVVGQEWNKNYPGTRSAVNVNDGKLYVFGGMGTLHCLDETTLNEVWKKNIYTEFDGRSIMFGITESPLIVGDKVFITPGGKKDNMVALNKNTGTLIWSSPGAGTTSAHCSPQFIDGNSISIVVTCTANEIIAFNADTGEVLWTHPQPSGNTIQPNTPLYSDGMIFSTTGYNGGSWLYRMTDDGRDAELVWHNDVDNQMGGAVKIDDYVYTSGHRKRGFACIDWRTGEIKWRVNQLAPSAIIAADGMLYAYGERDGTMALVKPNPDSFELVSSFKVTLGTNQHWPHPVIHDGVLYIRRGNVLMAYLIKQGDSG
ncbi:MAG: PQQ-binding-like beta-propeller repeat protein [Planctomycetaceae bacterium]|nr:PQQ-binding-like beta-propeller repeat protein [Planctomycetaceae bacterium]